MLELNRISRIIAASVLTIFDMLRSANVNFANLLHKLFIWQFHVICVAKYNYTDKFNVYCIN